ncbi:hydrogenase maturation factor [Anaerobacterium chartisolvens]|uniref:Hydrogenase maturation factor n=1 Tax=Anaerobacterium chartisolvens TaxID=1297424 RepID=A0A369B8D9_9FIRM|nr:AIR synthase family protein [Anaerobacterium chartisolvens]RCX16858.1 hydrogenase maturation factor [Anaerobacterium chartisolvens]
MEIGKLPNDMLQNIILNKIKHFRNDILVRPGIGEDCCAIDFGEYSCVMSSDPITGASNEIGRLAVHVSCNDVATCGVEPLGLLVTILAPVYASEKEFDEIMGQICDTAASIGVDILGGHTEVTDAVNRFVITTTSVGKVLKDKLVVSSGANPGDDIIITKSAGIEGTAIIAHDREDFLLERLDAHDIERAKGFTGSLSVVKEGVIAGKLGASAMHDVTEGGILGAVWEVATASGLGAEIYRESIPVEDITQKICNIFDIDPLKLISSGCMLIACKNGNEMLKALEASGIKASRIGKMTEDKETFIISRGKKELVSQPGTDELYKAT